MTVALCTMLGTFAAGCGNKAEESVKDEVVKDIVVNEEAPVKEKDIIDGGTYDNTNPDAQKNITSTEITSFKCWVSTIDFDDDMMVGNCIFDLNATLGKGVVTGSFKASDGLDIDREISLEGDDANEFMKELYGLVEKYDIAAYNGISRGTAGITPEYGIELVIDFASGERIYISDNTDCVLPVEWIYDCERLFEKASSKEPSLLDFVSENEFRMDESGGSMAAVSRPVYTLGYYTSDGSLVSPDGYDELALAINAINESSAAKVDEAWKNFEGKEGNWKLDPCDMTKGTVTRNDSEVVSFYEVREQVDDPGQKEKHTFITAHNLDAKTGKELEFYDVFKNHGTLKALLTERFKESYPDSEFFDDLERYIGDELYFGGNSIFFALGYGGVHFLADEYSISDTLGGNHITISYDDLDGMLREFYKPIPEKYLLPVEDKQTYHTQNGIGFKMSTEVGSGGSHITWNLELDGRSSDSYKETFYGSEPVCHLAHIGERDFIYLRIPVGDVSIKSNVYEVGADGIKLITQNPLTMAIDDETPLNPEWMCMNIDGGIYNGYIGMVPKGYYSINEEGLPEFSSGVYDLDGNWLRIKNGGRYYPDSADNAAVSGGMWTLIEGERVRPYQTDLESWIHFTTEDGRVIRFEIDKFGDGMLLNGEKLEHWFVADETAG
ncbi:MAG: hypothetical protein K6E91_14170 [Butyrivibrio sp.]|nr:hypothetical protein [Butyrivibrio sp.]